ncbi:MAG TPA: hypothetical protein VJM09_13665, partial [Sphingobium sp.]|nr:hypothetical protein [Sphingobium sp.]
MTDLESFAARLKTLTDGRASTPRIKDGIMTLALDVGGLSPERRDAVAAAIREGGLSVPGVEDVRIAMTSERNATAERADLRGETVIAPRAPTADEEVVALRPRLVRGDAHLSRERVDRAVS